MLVCLFCLLYSAKEFFNSLIILLDLSDFFEKTFFASIPFWPLKKELEIVLGSLEKMRACQNQNRPTLMYTLCLNVYPKGQPRVHQELELLTGERASSSTLLDNAVITVSESFLGW